MKIVSREYKMMLDPAPFADRDAAIGAFWGNVVDLTKMSRTVRATKEAIGLKEKRTITFLDTPDHALRRQDLILRRREGNGGAPQYTLKCRSEDRYYAAGTDVTAIRGDNPEPKLEEDISPPFLCRFSNSFTITLKDGKKGDPFATLGDAARTFPILGTLRQEGELIPAEAPLRPVRDFIAREEVYGGSKLVFGGNAAGSGREDVATAALIVWAGDKEGGPPCVVEFSFRLRDEREKFTRELVRAARKLYEAIQKAKWARPDSITKTAFAYGDRGDD